MNKLKFLAAAAVAISLVAAPALAKDAKTQSKQTMKMQKAGKQARAPAPRQQTWRNDRAADVQYDRGYDNRGYDNGGFWPGAVAAGIVGGAVNTAGAIAIAPFRNTYAYDNSYAYSPAPVYRSTYNADWNNNWARRQSVEQGGFICTPGTSYTNDYGYTQLCQ